MDKITDIRERRKLEKLSLEIDEANAYRNDDKYVYLTSDSGTLIIDNKFFVFFDWYEDVDKLSSF